MNGFIVVFKPTGMTSHDIVSRVRRLTGIRQVGHTGTLDPNASGVLPIAIGKATKAIPYLSEERKVYRAELALGVETDTCDRYGTEVASSEDIDRSKDAFLEAAKSFIGLIQQRPPIFSAIRIDGKRAYDLARSGKTPEMKLRDVTIESIDLISVAQNRFLFDVVCSKGTYIRSLCRDLAKEMGSLGHMSMLIRLESGIFTAENALFDWNQLENSILSIDQVLSHYPKIQVDKNAEKRLLFGQTIEKETDQTDEFFRVYSASGFLGIATCKNKQMKMKRQFI
ncbi:tRNA pseudouridine(55) synthase TruB [Gottschalkiaceae bacterium SANA]|nr:tRNA pseudouridine(55) synthase TruB [Gottschalkiaceae bacterium SANA]